MYEKKNIDHLLHSSPFDACVLPSSVKALYMIQLSSFFPLSMLRSASNNNTHREGHAMGIRAKPIKAADLYDAKHENEEAG